MAPTAVTEKLYGWAEKIWERLMEMPTSQEMQMEKRIEPQKTGSDTTMIKG